MSTTVCAASSSASVSISVRRAPHAARSVPSSSHVELLDWRLPALVVRGHSECAWAQRAHGWRAVGDDRRLDGARPRRLDPKQIGLALLVVDLERDEVAGKSQSESGGDARERSRAHALTRER